MDASVGGDGLQQAVDGDLQSGGVAVGQQVLQERMAGLVEQRSAERRRRWCSRSLVFLVFGMPSSSKSTTCNCFGEPRLICVPITEYAASAASRICVAEFTLEFFEFVGVDGDTRRLHGGQRDRTPGSSISASRDTESIRSSSASSASAEVGDRPGPQDQRLDRLVVDALGVVEQRKLLLFNGFSAQLATKVAQ